MARSSTGLEVGAAACLLAVAANGCSFLYAESPPPHHAELQYFDCPSSYVAPALDGVGAVVGGLFSLVLLAFATSPGPEFAIGDANAGKLTAGRADVGRTALLVAIPVVVTGLPAASAIYGFGKVGECRDAKAELMARLTAGSGVGGPRPGP